MIGKQIRVEMQIAIEKINSFHMPFKEEVQGDCFAEGKAKLGLSSGTLEILRIY